MAQEKQVILVPDYLTVRELADLMEASPIDVMKKLIANGIMASINQQVDFDTASIIVEEMGFEAQSATVAAAQEEREKAADAQEWRKVYATEKAESLARRPPIVTILGHVDHGKTTLLDTIRKANVVDGEAGGITQHIGAYRVTHDGNEIAFMDTPGHEAFTQMRARGAQGADIAILVVAADDGVMQTTREALNHAKAANIPIVVAITKVDKRNANPELVKQGLAELDIVPDDWGGDTLFVPVAALQGDGIDELLEALLLVAEDQDIVANPMGNLTGTVIEAEMDQSRGAMATLLVFNGTLKRGDTVIAGNTYGRIKAMFDEYGNPVKEAGPSTPVAVMGLNGLPEPGDTFERVKNEKTARSIIEERESDEVRAQQSQRQSVSLDDLFAQFQAGERKELNIILKADVQGSLQPIVDGLEAIETGSEGIGVKILSAEIGNVSENDVMLASASDALIIGFHVDVDNPAQRAATNHGVEIRKYDIIYKLFESVELALNGLLEPEYAETTIGRAEVRQVFRISRVGSVAGSYILDGEARRNARARVRRGDEVIVENTTVSSLKRFEEDVREVRTGFECGISLNNFNDFDEGDIIEFFVVERVN